MTQQTTQNTTQQTNLRIAIVGGGPAGLTLARILQTRNVPVVVYDRDASPEERPQGGTLDLHVESGQMALHMAGLDEQWHKIARYEDQNMRMIDKHGNVLFADEENQEGDRPEVDRTELRNLLLDSLAPGVVRWGHKLLSVQPHENDTYELHFEQGQSETFDLVVGADGAWSRVRSLLSDAVPSFTGVTFIEFGIDDIDQSHPDLARLVGHGTMFALAPNKGLFAQRNAHSHVRLYAALRLSESEIASLGFQADKPQVARTWLLERYADWDECLLALFRASNDRFAVRGLYTLPAGHSWEFREGVTLLGDAAHVLSPFSGEGVNLAMLDAANLADAITAVGDRNEAIRAFEKTMTERAAVIAKGAQEGLDHAIAPDAPAGALEFFREQMRDDEE